MDIGDVVAPVLAGIDGKETTPQVAACVDEVADGLTMILARRKAASR